MVQNLLKQTAADSDVIPGYLSSQDISGIGVELRQRLLLRYSGFPRLFQAAEGHIMARIFPAEINRPLSSAGQSGELATLALLRRRLPDEYTIFHSLNTARNERPGGVLTAVDFVVVDRAGRTLLIKQQSGQWRARESDPAPQREAMRGAMAAHMRRVLAAVREQFRRRGEGGWLPEVDFLIYCPNYKVRDIHDVGVDLEHVVDAASPQCLATRIERLLRSRESTTLPAGGAEVVFDVLRESFALVPHIHAPEDGTGERFIQLHEGLIQVVDNVSMQPYRLRVCAVPGSGKSHAACHAYRRAVAARKKTLFLGASQALMARLARCLPEGGGVMAFAELAQWINSHRPEIVDCLIVDDGDLFPEALRDCLKPLVGDASEVVWFENSPVTEAGGPPVWTPTKVTYTCHDNFRTPSRIAAWLRRTLEVPVNFRNPVPGQGVTVHACHSEAHQNVLVEQVAAAARAEGFCPDQIAILRLGHDGSTPVPAGHETLDVAGFHGQEAPVVIVTDIDPCADDTRFDERLFYAATRASWSLHLMVNAHNPRNDRFLAGPGCAEW